MRIEFVVSGRPPRKHGEKSMWARDDEAPFVRLLREKALEARRKLGIEDYFDSLVSLELTVFVPESQLESVGDLDNFITGLCDGLQAADPKALPHLHEVFDEVERSELHPRHVILIKNDSKVVSIFAKKVAVSEVNNPIQLTGQAKRSKYIEDHLKMGAEVLITDTNTHKQMLKFKPFPDDPKDWDEYKRRIRENLEKTNKIIADGVAEAKTAGKFGVQMIIRPVKRRLLRSRSGQKRLDSF